MPTKKEIKNGSVKPKSTMSEKETFDASEHKVVQLYDKHIITLSFKEFSNWVRQHEEEISELEQRK